MMYSAIISYQPQITSLSLLVFKGTAPASGISVLTAVLRKFLKEKCRVICATHFLELFSFFLFQDGQDGVKALQMSVHIPENCNDDALPLFKLKPGVANSSAGLVCAKMAAVDKTVIERANNILTSLKQSKPLMPVPHSLSVNNHFEASANKALNFFLAIDSWKNATDDDLRTLEKYISSM